MSVIKREYTTKGGLGPSHSTLKEISRQNRGFDANYYQPSLLFFSKSSNEKLAISDLLLTEVVPSIKEKKNYLDIGAGECEITREVGPSFKHVFAMDPRFKAKMQSNEFELWKEKAGYIFLSERFPLLGLPDIKFNFILASHFLYYSDKESWADTAKTAFSRLEDGGALAFIMNSDQGEAARMNSAFGGKNPNIAIFAKECSAALGRDVVNYSFTVNVQGIKLMDIARNAMFYMFDNLGDIKPAKLLKYLEKNFRQENGTYAFKLTEEAVVIYK